MAKAALNRAKGSLSSRAKCGCVIMGDTQRCVIGHNHPVGDGGEIIENGHTVNWVHAEQAAVCAAARLGFPLGTGAVAMSTERPCQNCMMLMYEAGVRKVYYINDYHTGAHGTEFCSEELKNKLDIEQYVYRDDYEANRTNSGGSVA